jgi:hypothetical protein
MLSMPVQGMRVGGSAGMAHMVGMGIAVAGGVSLLATVSERIYQKYQGTQAPTTAARSFISHTLAGMVVMVIRLVTPYCPFSVPAIAGLTLLSYLTMGVVEALFTKRASPAALAAKIVKVNKLEDTHYLATYLSLKPEHNVYLQAQKMSSPMDGTLQANLNSKEWEAFVEAAQGTFSLSSLAIKFASPCSDKLISKWGETDDIETSNREGFQFRISRSNVNSSQYTNDQISALSIKSGNSKLIAFSIADGSGPGLVADKANLGFETSVLDKMMSSDTQGLTPMLLVFTTVMAVKAAQESALSAQDGNESANACTTHLGLIVFTNPGQEKAHCCFSSVGDCKLFAKFPDGNVIDLTSTVVRPDIKDPGGQLGMKYRIHEHRENELLFGAIPDLRNFTVGYVQLSKGTILIPVTAGVCDNIGLKKIQEVITGKDGDEAVDAIIEAAKEAALQRGSKPDDTSCGWIPT